MAQINVIGYVTEDIVPRKSQNETAYVCFHLKEIIGKGRSQIFQVWSWGNTVNHMLRLNISKGSLIWVTGSLELVDCTVNTGRDKVKMLKVYASNLGFIPKDKNSQQTAKTMNADTNSTSFPIELDGDRNQLPK